ncbi:hypothetical protein KGF54_000147 [Candida jiufengensis]|uniref:uncharacterized protein n=1 Tax=Candida jiufengensis TaxID=497108 RepID=UPI002225630C|nr:uncharacterized protein KGF54_000147 [Candida jiufengensis]KAI5957219.1 hypothetical protein KGF54_000147 [Candida jiufengensis]
MQISYFQSKLFDDNLKLKEDQLIKELSYGHISKSHNSTSQKMKELNELRDKIYQDQMKNYRKSVEGFRNQSSKFKPIISQYCKKFFRKVNEPSERVHFGLKIKVQVYNNNKEFKKKSNDKTVEQKFKRLKYVIFSRYFKPTVLKTMIEIKLKRIKHDFPKFTKRLNHIAKIKTQKLRKKLCQSNSNLKQKLEKIKKRSKTQQVKLLRKYREFNSTKNEEVPHVRDEGLNSNCQNTINSPDDEIFFNNAHKEFMKHELIKYKYITTQSINCNQI